MLRNSVAFGLWQQRKQFCADLNAIYSAATETEAKFNLELFAENGTNNIYRSPSFGVIIGRILSPSLLSRPRFVYCVG